MLSSAPKTVETFETEKYEGEGEKIYRAAVRFKEISIEEVWMNIYEKSKKISEY